MVASLAAAVMVLSAAPSDVESIAQALEAFEPKVAALDPGDVTTANQLINDINALRTKLNRSQDKRNPAWRPAVDRSTALINRITEQAKKPRGEVSTNADRAMSGADRHSFGEYEAMYRRYRGELDALDPARLGGRNPLSTAAATMRKALERVVDQIHPRVVEAKKDIETFEADLAARVSEGQKVALAKAEALALEGKDFDGKVDALARLLPQEGFDCTLDRPFSEGRVRAWIARLKKLKATQAEAARALEAIVTDHPAFAEEGRIVKLRQWYTYRLPIDIESCIGRTATEANVSGGNRKGDFHQLIRIARETPNPSNLAAGAEAAEALAIFQEEYLGQSGAEARALAAQLGAKAGAQREKAAQALEARRMPRAMSTSAELRSIAEDTLKAAGYGTHRKLVINADKKHFQDTAEDTVERDGRVFLVRYPREWDEFQVCVAEQVKDAHRLVYYTIKKNQKAGAGSPIGRWYVSGRIVSEEILEKNID